MDYPNPMTAYPGPAIIMPRPKRCFSKALARVENEPTARALEALRKALRAQDIVIRANTATVVFVRRQYIGLARLRRISRFCERRLGGAA